MTTYRFRAWDPNGPWHVASLLSLMRECWLEVAPGIPWRPQVAVLERYLETRALRVWTAESEGELVGYVSGYVATCFYSGRRCATEDALYVRPAHRLLVGLKLTEYVIGELAAEGVERIETTSRPERRLQGFMRQVGFREIAATYERDLRH